MTASPRDSARNANDALIQSVSDTRNVLIQGNQIDSSQLFVDGREITIAHGEGIYRLRLTSQNKLILTK